MVGTTLMGWLVALACGGYGAPVHPQAVARAGQMAHARCAPVNTQPRQTKGTLRFIGIDVDQHWRPGKTVTIEATVADVSGHGDLDYPGIGLEIAGPQLTGTVFPAEIRYGVNACGAIKARWTVELPVLTESASYTLTLKSGPMGCGPSAKCEPEGTVRVRRVLVVEGA